MIINIPIQVDEKAIEEKTLNEYQSKVDKLIVDKIERVLVNKNSLRWYGAEGTAQDGMKALVETTVERYVNTYVNSHIDEILDKAVDKLEKRLMNRKRIKEVGESEDNR